MISSPLGTCQGVTELGHGRLILSFLRVPHTLISRVRVQFAIPPPGNSSCFLSHPLAFVVGCCVDLCPSKWGKMKSQNCLIFISIIARGNDDYLKKILLSLLFCLWFFWELSDQIPGPFFECVFESVLFSFCCCFLVCFWDLYIFWILKEDQGTSDLRREMVRWVGELYSGRKKGDKYRRRVK